MATTYISVQEAAKASGMCDETIRRYCKANRIKGAVKTLKAWRVPDNWLEQFNKEITNGEVDEGSR